MSAGESKLEYTTSIGGLSYRFGRVGDNAYVETSDGHRYVFVRSQELELAQFFNERRPVDDDHSRYTYDATCPKCRDLPAQPDRPEPVDPASVRVGDLAQIAKVTPCSCSAQRARANKAEAETERLRNEIGRLRDRCAQLYTEANHARSDRPDPVSHFDVRPGDRVEVEHDGPPSWRWEAVADNAADEDGLWLSFMPGGTLLVPYDATVRVLHDAEPEPDQAAVEALAEILGDAVVEAANTPGWESTARELIRRGVTIPTICNSEGLLENIRREFEVNRDG